MSARLKFSVVFFSTLLTLMLVIGALTGKGQDKEEGAYRPLSVYTEVLARIKTDYVEEPDMKKVTRGALHGLVEFLDPLSSYLTAEQYEAFQQTQSNEDGGSGLSTGLIVFKRSSYTHVLGVLPDSGAARAGIQPGDIIEAVDGLSTRAMPPAYLQSVLSGDIGSRATLLVRAARRPDEPEEFVLLRTAVKLPPMKHRLLQDWVGYIDLDVVDAQHVDEVAKAMRDLQSQGATKFILDLRGAALGEPSEGVRLADLFVGGGKLASVKGQRYPEQVFEGDAAPTLSEAPLVVIADRSTVGGAEVAAAAILDRGRGEVVGERTYGLASVQKTIALDDGAALVLSVAKFYRPSGKAIHDGGIEPSMPVGPEALRKYRQAQMEGGPQTPIDPSQDPFLQKALEVLKDSGAARKAA